jgi:hypothetical protein
MLFRLISSSTKLIFSLDLHVIYFYHPHLGSGAEPNIHYTRSLICSPALRHSLRCTDHHSPVVTDGYAFNLLTSVDICNARLPFATVTDYGTRHLGAAGLVKTYDVM